MKNKLIGIIGGGQLARMMVESATNKFNAQCIVLDPNEKCSASLLANQFICAEYEDEKCLNLLFEKSDIVTYEFENINCEILKKLENKFSNKLIQTTNPLFISQNRLREKNIAKKNNIPTINYQEINNINELKYFLNKYKKVVLKTQELGYDGKGQIIIDENNYLQKEKEIFHLLQNYKCVGEEFIDFLCEVSIIGTIDKNKNCSTFPLFLNLHEHNILFTSEVLTLDNAYGLNKQQIAALNEKAREYFYNYIKYFNSPTILTIEFFVDKNFNLIFNEIAPRVHNSGHHTIVNFNNSQFDLINNLFFENKNFSLIANPNQYILVNILGHRLKYFLNWKKENEFLLKNKLVIFYDYHKNSFTPFRKVAHLFIAKNYLNNEQIKNLINNLRY